MCSSDLPAAPIAARAPSKPTPKPNPCLMESPILGPFWMVGCGCVVVVGWVVVVGCLAGKLDFDFDFEGNNDPLDFIERDDFGISLIFYIRKKINLKIF